MNLLQQCTQRNKILTRLGLIHVVIAILLLIYLLFNDTVVLGLNAVIKPVKFALSIAIYSFSMAWFLYYLQDQRKVRRYSWVAVIAMLFEQFAITIQALRGEKSHFNRSSLSGEIIFGLMGVAIVTLTLWTAYMAYLFIRQKNFTVNRNYILGIRIGIVFFVIFSLFGGFIAQRSGHTVGGEDGGPGLPFVNWSVLFGDLRVPHFWGLHALQIIPLFAWLMVQFVDIKLASRAIWIFSIVYFSLVIFTMVEALRGTPLVAHS